MAVGTPLSLGMRPSYDFDASTGCGQKRLMAVSMGLDSETYIARPLRSAPAISARPASPPKHPLIGALIRATWRPKLFNAVTTGEVIRVDPVFSSPSLRLVVLRDDGNEQACYTQDPDWLIEGLPA